MPYPYWGAVTVPTTIAARGESEGSELDVTGGPSDDTHSRHSIDPLQWPHSDRSLRMK